MAQQVDIEKIEIKLMLCEKHRYTIDNIPVFVNIKNNNSVPVKLLSPYDKKGKYLSGFEFICVRADKSWESTSIFEQSRDINNLDFLNYIDILPDHEESILIMLNEILTPKLLLPGEYKITMAYRNILGENFLVGHVKAVNEVSVVIGDEVEETPKPEYISKAEAINIAIKTNKLEYDKSQEIKVFLKDGIFTVTFPFKLPKGARGPDFSSKIKIEAKTGKIVSVMVGN